MPKVGLTDIQREYEKAFKDYEKRLFQVEEQGYNVPESKRLNKLVRPKRASIEKVKSQTKREIKEAKGTTFTYTDEQGKQKTVSGKEGAKIQRSRASKKGWETRRKKQTPKQSEGEILWNELFDIAQEYIEHPSARIRGNARRLISTLNRHNTDEDYKRLEELNSQELLEKAREAMKYDPKDNSSQNMALLEIEILLSERPLSMQDIEEREREDDNDGEEDEGWEYVTEEEIPF